MAMNKGMLLVLMTAVVSGFSIFINASGVKGFDSSVFAFSKNVVVAVFLFGILLGIDKLKELVALSKKQWLQLAGVGLIGGSIPFLLFFKGLQMTTGSTSAFIHKTLFVFVSVIALIFLKEKLSKGLVIGAVLLLLGNFFLLRPDFSLSVGHVLVFGATLFWACELVLSKHILKELSGTLVAFGRMFFGSVFILMFLVGTGKEALVLSMSSAQYGWIMMTSLFLFLYVFSFYNGLKDIKVSTAACILLLGSPITMILGVVFKGASLGAYQALGIVLLVLGVGSVVWSSVLFSGMLRLLGVRRYGRH